MSCDLCPRDHESRDSFDLPEQPGYPAHGVDMSVCSYHGGWITRWLENGRWPKRVREIAMDIWTS